jgi:hypothetical protein
MRVVVGVAPGHEPAAVAEELVAKGAREVQGPAPSLPDVLVAEFPEGDVDETVKSLAEIPGVRYAEPDAMRSILD